MYRYEGLSIFILHDLNKGITSILEIVSKLS